MSSPNMLAMDSVAKLKAALDSERGALGPFMITSDPAFVEAAGYAGYDFALLDMEHGPGTFQNLQNLIRAANVAGICPVVRVPRGTDIWIGRAPEYSASHGPLFEANRACLNLVVPFAFHADSPDCQQFHQWQFEHKNWLWYYPSGKPEVIKEIMTLN